LYLQPSVQLYFPHRDTSKQQDDSSFLYKNYFQNRFTRVRSYFGATNIVTIFMNSLIVYCVSISSNNNNKNYNNNNNNNKNIL